MLGKLAVLMQSKTALAVLGIVLVGGSGGAVAAAAASGHLTTHGINLNSEKASTQTPDSHANTVGIEGLLTACNTTATPNTISVKDSAGKSWTFVVSATTKINGDTHTAGQGASGAQGGNGAGASSAKGDNSAHAGDSSDNGAGSSGAKGDNSAKGASSAQGDNSAHAGASAHAAPTLADVCTTANIGSRTVQVQATADGANYDAWKVTLQGPGSANAGSGSDDSSAGGSSSASGD